MSGRRRGIIWCAVAVGLSLTASAAREEPPSTTPSPKAVEALRLVESKDPYQQQLGFLRLEALREASTAPLIRQ